MTSKTSRFLSVIASNPGISAAELHRRIGGDYAHGHHKFSYATVTRMVRNGLIVRGPANRESARGGASGLYVAGPNVDSIKAGVILFGSLG